MLNVTTETALKQNRSVQAGKKMRIAFVDASGWDYHVLSVLERPMGGSQSAACYLARALGARGHDLFLVTNTSTPGNYGGVECLAFGDLGTARVRELQWDVCVCMLCSELGNPFRVALGPACRIVLWNQHGHDQPAVQSLRDVTSRGLFDGFAMVSQWQASCFERAFEIDRARIGILRNAIAPAFSNLFTAGSNILAEKQWPPILAYTSTPFRGLDVLLDAFPRIRSAIPGTQLEVYSSMGVYQMSAGDDEKQFGGLYERCRRIEGIKYVGSVPQPDLARALKRVSALAYPNTFPETSCISVMEAMASGCLVVTSDLGALPETTAGFAKLVPIQSSARADYLDAFVNGTVETVRRLDQMRVETEQLLRRQVADVNDHATWAVRAAEWERWLYALCERR